MANDTENSTQANGSTQDTAPKVRNLFSAPKQKARGHSSEVENLFPNVRTTQPRARGTGRRQGANSGYNDFGGAVRGNGEANVFHRPWDRFVYLKDENKFLDLDGYAVIAKGAAEEILRSRYNVKNITKFLHRDEINGRIVSNTMYMPTMPQGIIQLDGASYFNSFRADVVTTEPNTAWEDTPLGQALLAQLAFMFPSETHATERSIMEWFLAHNMRHPGVKIRWAPLLVGPQGDGKSTLLNTVTAVLGNPNVHILQEDEMDSGFTAWPGSYAYVVVEELFMGGGKYRLYEKMKPYITNSRVSNNTKMLTVRDVYNHTNVGCATNHGDAVPVGVHDRRWSIIHTALYALSIEESTRVVKQEEARLIELAIMLEQPEAGAILLGWANSIDLKAHNPNGRAPATKAKLVMEQDSKNKDQAWLEECIDNGTYRGITRHAVHLGSVSLISEMKRNSRMAPGRAKDYLKTMGYAPLLHVNGREYRDKLWVDGVDARGNSFKDRRNGNVMLRMPTDDLPDPTGMFHEMVAGKVSFADYSAKYMELAKAAEHDDLPF